MYLEMSMDGGQLLFLRYMAWDTGTRNEGLSHAAAMARLIHATDADGMNMDTLHQAPREFFDQTVKAGKGAAVQVEHGSTLANIKGTTLEWGESGGWWDLHALDGERPLVSLHKVIEPRCASHPGARCLLKTLVNSSRLCSAFR